MRILLALIMSWLTLNSAVEAGELSFASDTPYYFEQFDPQQKPWQPGHGLNIEEVFKNFQYYEILFHKNRQEIQVNHYVQGSKEGSERYRIEPDGSLEKLPR